jgi:hypothetical protein
VRRFPHPDAGGAGRLRPLRVARPSSTQDALWDTPGDPPEPLTLVQRIEAFLTLYDSLTAPRTAALLTSGRHLQGCVVRDPAVVRPLAGAAVHEPAA